MDEIGVLLIWLLPLALCLHIVEEFGFPGGFINWYKAYRPKFAASMTPAYFIRLNGIGIIAAILIALGANSFLGIRSWLAFLTAFAGFNALFHIRGAIKTKQYCPGMVTAGLFYLPLTVTSYIYFLKVGKIDIFSSIVCILIGSLYQLLVDYFRDKGMKFPAPATQDSPGQNSPSGRLYFLDNLRTFIILLVVLFHTAYAYSIYFSQGFYVLEKQKNLLFDIFIINAEVFMMPVMFFIAGYFGIRSLSRKSQGAFWKDKLFRIVLPWVLGVIFLAPAMGYVHFLSQGQFPSYLHYWAKYFSSEDYRNIGQVQYYFLGILTLFYLILSIAYRIYKPLGNVSNKTPRFSNGLIILFGAVVSIVIFCGNLMFDDNKWYLAFGILNFLPTRIIPYLLYFFLGVYAYRQQWFTASGYTPKLVLWRPACIVFFILFDQTVNVFNTNKNLLSIAGYSVFRAFFCLCMLILLLDIFRKRLNYTTQLMKNLSANSYAIYFVHFIIAIFVILAFRDIQLSVFIKYPCAGILSIAASYLISRYALSIIPIFSGNVSYTRVSS